MGTQSAMSTALTGLNAATTTIDVVGNNLANSNTVGFKASEAAFATQFLQTLSLGSAPSGNNGGSNPTQTGLGTMVAEITPNFTQGTMEISSNPTDLAIQGDGFFIVQGSSSEERLYTRNGIFKLNPENQLVTITGNRLLGYGIDEQFDVQRTLLAPIEINLGAAAVAEATETAFLEGALIPHGDLATTAERIRTGILGDGSFTAPTTMTGAVACDPPDLNSGGAPLATTTLAGGGPAIATVAGDFTYRFVFADGLQVDTATTESIWSSDVTVSVLTGVPPDDEVQLDNLPVDGDYSYVRIYRTVSSNDPAYDPDTFYFLGEEDITGAAPFGFSDTNRDVNLLAAPPATLNTDTLEGQYRYYVTFADAAGGPPNGRESRPSPISDPATVSDGRVVLTGLPTGDPDEWTVRRIYRNVADDLDTFYYVDEILGVTGDVTYTDKIQDDAIEDPDMVIDLDGPKIIESTLLTDVLSRDGDEYNQLFEEGTLQFTGRKGERKLAEKELEIVATTTVGHLINFMDQALGIQDADDDTVNEDFPVDAVSGATPGGLVTSDGRILMTANNGVENAIGIKGTDFTLVTAAGSASVDMQFGSVQSAVGESAVTDFIVYDSLGIPIRVRLTAALESRTNSTTTYRWFADSPDNDPSNGSEIAVGTGLITFDENGNLVEAPNALATIRRQNVSSASPLQFDLDFSGISGLASSQSTLAVSRQDGSGPGQLTSFVVGEDGSIRGVFSNGVTRTLGQIRLARFANPAGLEQRGENLYAEGINSGLPVEGDPGQQGIGGIIAGAVELSNTDIGSNLIDLILASTMYRGNTRVISTAQEMINELLSLRR